MAVFDYPDSTTIPPIQINPHPDYIISPGPAITEEPQKDCGCGGKCKGKKKYLKLALIVGGIIIIAGTIYYLLKK